ncbi:PUA-like domain containing protein [Amanita muscaria]
MLADSLRALLLCPICAALLSVPSSLPCGHSICAHHSQPCPCSPSPSRSKPISSSSKIPVIHPPSSFRALSIPTEHKPDVVLNKLISLLDDHSGDDAALEKALFNELTCVVCFVLLYEPITTPCQHTFCTRCLHRSLDHSNMCPVCRKDLPNFASVQETQPNQTILSIILKTFPTQYQERAQAIEAEARNARLDTPIFVCNLSFPGTPTVLHLFEPRYRLMLRRCLESATPRFGMVMPPKPGCPQMDYGTMLEIRNVQMLPDGRSIVETWGTHRFRVMEQGTLDGYTIGRIERVDDCPDEMFDPQATPSNAELMQTCRTFLDRLQRGTAPWVVQRLNNAYGTIPDDPSAFSFWVALVLPIDEHEKAKLLPIRSARLRLLMVTHWIEQLNNNWYASGYWWERGRVFMSGLVVYIILLLIGWL